MFPGWEDDDTAGKNGITTQKLVYQGRSISLRGKTTTAKENFMSRDSQYLIHFLITKERKNTCIF